MTYLQRIGITAASGAVLGTLVMVMLLVPSEREEVGSFIVQGQDLAGVRAAVEAVGGAVTHELGIIKAVGTELTKRQVEALREMPNVRRVYANSGVRTSAVASPATATVSTRVSSGYDDVEETGPEGTDRSPGFMYNGSSDLEIVRDDDWGIGGQTIELYRQESTSPLFSALA